MANVQRVMKPSSPISFAKWYVSLGLLLAGMTGFLLYAYATGRRMVSFQVPLVYAAKEIQLEAISGHLRFEEVLNGEFVEPLDRAWAHYRTAVMYADAMLEGGETPEGPVEPLNEAALRAEIAALKGRVRELQEVTRQRIASEHSPNLSTSMQNRYHELFHQITQSAENVGNVLEQRIGRELVQFRLLHAGLLLAGLLGAAFVGSIFLLFERRTTFQFRALVEAQHQAKESEERFQGLFDHMADPLFVMDLGGQFLDVNRRACEVLGYDRGELLTKGANDVEVGMSQREILQIHTRLEPGKPVLVEGIYRRKDGTTFPVEVHVQRLEWSEQPVVIGLARDVSARKRSEAALREREQLYQSLAEVSPVGIYRTDANGGYVYINSRWAAIAGLDLEQARGNGWSRSIHPDDRERVMSRWRASVREGQSFGMEYRFLSPAGVTTWVVGNSAPVPGTGGEILGHVGTVTDISDRRRGEEELRAARNDLEIRVQERTASLQTANLRLLNEIKQRAAAEEALQYSEAKYSTLVESSPSGIFIYRENRFVFVNPALVAMFGHTKEELLAMDVLEIVHPDDRERVRETARRRLAGELAAKDYEFRVVAKSGETRWVHLRAVRIQYRGNVSTLGNITDVTERKRIADALQVSQEELRRLSGEVLLAQEEERARVARELHDSIGQSLSAIKFYVESALPQYQGTEAGEQVLRTAVVRVQQTVEEVCRISMDLRPSSLDDLGLLATIGWHCREFERQYPSIQVDPNLEIDEEEVPDPLKIVLFRILQEAMSNVGKHSGASRVEVSISHRGSLLELGVVDDGGGLDAAELEQRPASMHGYGLRSMRQRAEMAGGTLSIGSSDGGGTVIRTTWDLAATFTD